MSSILLKAAFAAETVYIVTAKKAMLSRLSLIVAGIGVAVCLIPANAADASGKSSEASEPTNPQMAETASNALAPATSSDEQTQGRRLDRARVNQGRVREASARSQPVIEDAALAAARPEPLGRGDKTFEAVALAIAPSATPSLTEGQAQALSQRKVAPVSSEAIAPPDYLASTETRATEIAQAEPEPAPGSSLETTPTDIPPSLAPAPQPSAPSAQTESPLQDAPPPDAPTEAGALNTGLPPIETLDPLEPSPNPLLFPTEPSEVEIQTTGAITLEQALELARRNNRELQASQLELERAIAAMREQEAALYPTLQVGSNLNFTENQTTSDEQLQNIFNPDAAQDQDDIDVDLSLVARVEYDLFTSGRRAAAIRAAERRVRFQELQVEVLLEQLRLDVATDYYDLQQAGEEVRIAQDSLQQAERSLRDAQALEQAGVGTRFDVLQAQVDVANSQQELTQAISQREIAQRQLAQRLNIAQTATLVAADPVAVSGAWDLNLEETIVKAYRNRAELEQQLVEREAANQQRRAALATLGPQISLFGQYQAANRLNQDGGFNDEYQFGAQLSLTLFDGGAARARARQEELNIAIAETNFAGARDSVRFQVEQAYSQLQANRANIDTARLGVEQASEALRLARLRFQAGVGTQTDVLRAQTELTRAEVNLVNAVLGYNRSLVSLERSVSNLPNEKLSDALP